MKDYEGDLFTLIEEAQSFALKNIHIGERLEGLRRVDVPEIDKSALREAIINAFCHRDYHNPDSVHVAVFPDRVEIRSPGRLYGTLTIERMMRGNVSERRNELIAAMLVRVQYIEAWGRGIPLILQREPSASFEEVGRQFYTVFKRKGAVETAGKAAEKPPANYHTTTIELPEKYSKTAQRIILEIGQKPDTTAKELSKKIKISEDGIVFALKQLKKDGWIRHVGPNKGGRWEVRAKKGKGSK